MERGRNQVRLLILSDTSPHYFFSRTKRVEEVAMKLTTTMMTLMRMENMNHDDDENGDADVAIVGS